MHAPLSQRFPLRPGKHPTREHGLCAMELVAWLAGEPHSDHPECTCPVLSALVRTFNDVVPDSATRERHVRPLVPRLIRNVVPLARQQERAFDALDHAVREFAPRTLEALGQPEAARALRNLDPIRDTGDARRASAMLKPLGRTVYAAYWTAARAAEGHPTDLWISGVVHAAKAAGAWGELRRLLERLTDTRVATHGV